MGKVEYVVVTRYQKTPKSKPIVHAYGPYPQDKARSVKGRMKREAERLGYASSIEISCNHMLDPEGWEGPAHAIREELLSK
jgi:hypothetical protein